MTERKNTERDGDDKLSPIQLAATIEKHARVLGKLLGDDNLHPKTREEIEKRLRKAHDAIRPRWRSTAVVQRNILRVLELSASRIKDGKSTESFELDMATRRIRDVMNDEYAPSEHYGRTARPASVLGCFQAWKKLAQRERARRVK
jgi:hypothetical protein